MEAMKGAEFFTRENYGVLSDPRAEIIVDDIGHYLRTTKERFDIISADGKTTEKHSSNAFAYSQEYYRLLSQHLNDDGMMIQWVAKGMPCQNASR